MERFFHPKKIILYGASSNPHKGGHHVLKNIKQYSENNQNVEFYIIHPKSDVIEGIQCFRNISDIKSEKGYFDLAIIVVPIDAVMDSVRECIKQEVKGILIESGLLDIDPKKAEEYGLEVRSLIKGKDIRIVGPNSIGFNVPSLKYCTPLNYNPSFLQTRRRNVSFCGQSGLFVAGFVEQFISMQPFGIANSAAIGNKLDVNECDILEYYFKDEKTHVIGLYLEDIKDGTRFLSLIKKNKQKPIVLLKSGKSEQGKKAIASHTGSLAGNYKIVKGLSNQFGIYLVDTYGEMFDMISILCQYPAIASPSIGVISISGSGCVMAADYAEKYNLNLADLSGHLRERIRKFFPIWAPIHNPLDTWASIERVGSITSFRELLKAFLEEKTYNVIVLMTIATDLGNLDWKFLKIAREKYPDTVIILHFFGGDKLSEYTKKAINYEIPVIQDLQFIFKSLAMMRKNYR
ncbi:MAG: CoA-binding protein, partial [Promethearchaeota archaeon]